MKMFFIKMYVKRNSERFVKYISWLNYQTGFSGIGPTALDVKPDFDMPKVPKWFDKIFVEDFERAARFHWEAWIDASMGSGGVCSYSDWKCPKLGYYNRED